MKNIFYPVELRSVYMLVLLLLATAGHSVAAGNQTWDGGAAGTGTAWLTNANWIGDTAYAGIIGSSANTDIATFTAGTNGTAGFNMTTASGNFSLGAIDFNRSTAMSVTATSTTGVLRLNGATVNSVANTLVRLTGSTSDLTIGGTTSLGLALGITNGTFFVDTGRTLTTHANTVISEVNAGSGFTKAGAGIMEIFGAGTYSGTVTVNEGRLTVSNNNALGTAGLTLNGTGAEIRVSNGITTGSSNNLVVADTGDGKMLSGFGGSNGFSGSIDIQETTAGNFEIQSGTGSVVTISGNITGTGGAGLKKSGLGSLVLSGASNGYSGTTRIQNGSIQITGGALSSGSNIILGNSATSGKLILGGASAVDQTVSDLATSGSGTTNAVVGGAASVSTLTVNNSGSSSYSGVLGGAGTNENNLGLTKTNTGTLTLSGTNTYTGNTLVQGGTLLISSTGSISNSAVIQVQSGAVLDVTAVSGGFQLGSGQKLQNKGTFLGNLTALSGSTFAPGNSPGISTQTGDLTLNTGSTFEFELVANTTSAAGTNYDQTQFTLASTTNLTIQSGVNVNLVFNYAGSTVDWSSTFWDSNQSWLVFTGADTSTFGGGSGIFTGTMTVGLDSLAQNFSLAGGSFSFNNTGSEVYLNYAAAIPEPSTYAMFLAGLGLLAYLRRKRA